MSTPSHQVVDSADRISPEDPVDPIEADASGLSIDQNRGVARTAVKAKTAVVVVHGMGSQKPRDTVNGFIQTALKPLKGGRIYYSRPDHVSASYEARRLLAIERKQGGAIVQNQTEFFEYHWSYMMTGNQFRDLLPTSLRLLLRSPLRLPWQLRIPWLVMVALLVVLAWTTIELVLDDKLKKFGVSNVIEAYVPSAPISAVVTLVVFVGIGWLTSSFVDVVRYLDASPRSYDVRRAIRKGMVDLLANLHTDGRYSRIVVVAHSLGGYIAYDGLAALWDGTDRKKDDPEVEFDELEGLRDAAQGLLATPTTDPAAQGGARAPVAESEQPTEGGEQSTAPSAGNDGESQNTGPAEEGDGPEDRRVIAFRAAQFELWKELQEKGIDWRVTDLITLGTPMYLADMLMTRCGKEFAELRKRSEIPQCPPRSDSETVEGKTPAKLMYGRREGGTVKNRLVTGSPFAVVRWSNYWFPPKYGLFGDPFGGSLANLFGAGIDNRPVDARKIGRYIPIWAHTRYFKYPNLTGRKSVAPVIRTALALDLQIDIPSPGVAETSSTEATDRPSDESNA